MVNLSSFSAMPNHLAIIMDGNCRWASSRCKTKTNAYLQGSKVACKIAEYCASTSIRYLTLYAFSIENWLRPKEEVNNLLELFCAALADKKKMDLICQCDIKLNFIGNLSLLPDPILEQIKKSEELTCNNTSLLLTIAVSYSARQEITHAVGDIIRNNVDCISENEFEKFLYTKDLPALDFLIRTGGEKRLSNFLLWQAAYAELYFCNTLWPNFSCRHLIKALKEYEKRERKYGR